jgi:hypothetical protein
VRISVFIMRQEIDPRGPDEPVDEPGPEASARRPLGLTVRAFTTFVFLDLGFRLLGLDRTLALVLRGGARPANRSPAESRRQATRTFAAVRDATLLYYRRRKDCLPKALTTAHLLRRQGIAAEICFGVKKFPFAAHSWVEAGGEQLDDDPPRLRHYTVIHRIAC